jgi:FKBP-type peptidyl-prolyl cis-trans isomerase FkpA
LEKMTNREARRARREAERRRQQIILAGAGILIILLIGIYAITRFSNNKNSNASQATPTDLVSEDLVVGTGDTAQSGDTVSVNYTGWLTDGTQFDSSYDRGQPFTFQLGVGAVIAGWDQGVVGMKVGGKRRLTIPPDLAYGTGGRGSIPPNATLIFEVELVEIKQ